MSLDNGILQAVNDESGGLGRAVLVWALFDNKNTLLVKDSYILGKQKETLFEALDNYAAETEMLFLSVEPASSFINVHKLTRVLNALKIKKIIIGCRFKPEQQCPQWVAWLAKQTCNMEYLEPSAVSARISRGAVKAHTANRPWVTCVSAAHLSGARANLSQIDTDVGFNSYLKQLITVNAAVWCSSGTVDLPSFFHSEDSSVVFGVAINKSELEFLRDKLMQLVEMSICSLCIVCDMTELDCLMQAGLVDEIVHHVVSVSPSEQQPHSGESLTSSDIDFSNWKLVSSAPLGNCSRVVLINNASDNVSVGATNLK